MLADHDLPQWADAYDPEVSCISDGEMARINIEASAALSDWIDLMRADQQHFRKLVKAAAQLLHFPITQLDGSTYYNRFRAFSAINSVNGRRYLMEAFARDFGSEWLEREKARLIVNPTRALANGILNEHWRNGSGIKDVHAGSVAPPRPLTQCRRRTEAADSSAWAALIAPWSGQMASMSSSRVARRFARHKSTFSKAIAGPQLLHSPRATRS